MTEESFGMTNEQHHAHYYLDRIAKLEKKLAEFEAKEGPLNAESMTLDELLDVLAKWKAVASGRTCVSFECLCFGASSLWHQTHRNNFRKINRKPAALSRWVLENFGGVRSDFAAQVLELLVSMKAKADTLQEAGETALRELNCLIDQAAARGYTSGGPKLAVEKLCVALTGRLPNGTFPAGSGKRA